MTPGTRKWLSRLVKLVVCAGALWYLSDKVTIYDRVRLAEDPSKQYALIGERGDVLRLRDLETRHEREVLRGDLARPEQLQKGQRVLDPGLLSITRRADWSWLGWSFLAMGPSVFIMAWRLRLLLGTQDIHLSLHDALLLTFAGNFFNFAMPGTTGGDIYKAYHVARQTPKRAEAVTIVILDRAIGFISFLLIAAGTILIVTLTKHGAIGLYGRWVGYSMIALMVVAGLFFSRRVRRWIRYDAILAKLPFADKLRRIDETTFSFRFRPAASAISLVVTLISHVTIVVSVYALAHGLGVRPHGGQTEGDMFVASILSTTVGYLFAAIPISIQGFGLFEAVFYRVFVEGGWCTAAQMLALTLGVRIVQIIWSLPGVAVPWMGFARPSERE